MSQSFAAGFLDFLIYGLAGTFAMITSFMVSQSCLALHSSNGGCGSRLTPLPERDIPERKKERIRKGKQLKHGGN